MRFSAGSAGRGLGKVTHYIGLMAALGWQLVSLWGEKCFYWRTPVSVYWDLCIAARHQLTFPGDISVSSCSFAFTWQIPKTARKESIKWGVEILQNSPIFSAVKCRAAWRGSSSCENFLKWIFLICNCSAILLLFISLEALYDLYPPSHDIIRQLKCISAQRCNNLT